MEWKGKAGRQQKDLQDFNISSKKKPAAVSQKLDSILLQGNILWIRKKKLQQEKHNKIGVFLRDFQLSLELLSALWENVDVNGKQDNRFLSVLFFNSLFIVRKAEQTLWFFFFRDYWEI